MSVEDYQRRMRQDYKTTFGSPHGERVLADLARVCGATVTTFRTNPFEMARNEGMRGVFLYVQGLLDWDESKIREIVSDSRSRKRDEVTQ